MSTIAFELEVEVEVDRGRKPCRAQNQVRERLFDCRPVGGYTARENKPGLCFGFLCGRLTYLAGGQALAQAAGLEQVEVDVVRGLHQPPERDAETRDEDERSGSRRAVC